MPAAGSTVCGNNVVVVFVGVDERFLEQFVGFVAGRPVAVEVPAPLADSLPLAAPHFLHYMLWYELWWCSFVVAAASNVCCWANIAVLPVFSDIVVVVDVLEGVAADGSSVVAIAAG